eukprot:3559791-Prymnesium_polylepis.1
MSFQHTAEDTAATIDVLVTPIADAHIQLLDQVASPAHTALVSSSASVSVDLSIYEASVDPDCNLYRHLPRQQGVSFVCLDISPPPRSPPPAAPPDTPLFAMFEEDFNGGNLSAWLGLLSNAGQPAPESVVVQSILPVLELLLSDDKGSEADVAIQYLAVNQLRGVSAGMAVSYDAPSFSVNIARTSLPPPPPPGTSPPPDGVVFAAATIDSAELYPGVDVGPVRYIAAFNDPGHLLDASSSSVEVAGQVFNPNPQLPALQGREEVDTLLTYWKNAAAFSEPPGNASVSRVDSMVTSLTILDGVNAVDIAGTNAVIFRIPFQLSVYSPSELECGRPQEECDEETRKQRTQLINDEQECERLATKSVWGGRDELNACVARLQELESNLTRHVGECRKLPAPCNGR